MPVPRTPSSLDRRQSLAHLQSESDPWDLLIVGGGAAGLGAAVDSAARGYRTVLLEQADFAQATSSRSTKLVHGGVRYLRQGNIALVRESLRERSRLLRNAPGLVHPLDFIVPLYRWLDGPYYRTGLKLYDWLARGRQPHPSRRLTATETLARLPTANPQGLRGGVLYADAQFDDARLAITLARTASARGAVVLNHVRVESLLKSGGRVRGVEARDRIGGAAFTVTARAVLNAGGPFADTVRRMDDPGAPNQLTFSQGAHLVLPRRFLPGDAALLVPKTADGRVLFVVPWLDRVIVGTTDTPVPTATLEPRARVDEIDFLLEHTAEVLALSPTRSDVLSVYAGVRALVARGNVSNTAALSRGHLISVSSSGLVTIAGGKWTTYRRIAEEAVDRAAAVAGLPVQTSETANLRLDLATVEPGTFLDPELPVTDADVIRAVREEGACRIEDILARRTRALLLDARRAMGIAPAVAARMGELLGWNAEKQQQELQDFLRLAGGYLMEPTA